MSTKQDNGEAMTHSCHVALPLDTLSIDSLSTQINDGKTLKDSLVADTSLLDLNTTGGRSSVLLALLHGVSRGILPTPKLVACVKELGYTHDEEKYELGDLVWMSWLLQEGSEDSKPSERIVEAAVGLVEEGFLSRRILMEVSDGDFMETAGLVNSYKDGWRKREIRLNTRNVYAQRKFNLLREESEGYSKITTLLNQAGTSRVSEANMDGILKEIKSIVGYFDLDPNRVSSLVLDAYASYPENEDFVSLIKGFGVQKCVQFLGFRLSRDDAIHSGVLKIAAILVKKGLIRMEDLMVYFSPAEEDYASSWTERLAQLDDAIQHIGVISLSSKEPSTDEQVPRKSGQTARTITIDTAMYRNKPWESGVDHRLEFLGELFTCDAWDEAILFSKYLSKLGIRDIAAYESVGKAICTIIDKELVDTPSDKDVSLSDKASSCIQMIGCHLHFNLKAFYKVITLVTRILDSGEQERAHTLLVNTVFPAYNLVPSNVALSHTLWNTILCKMTYEERFRLYAEFQQTVKQYPLLQASEKLAETEVRRILRRVTAPANKKEAKMAMRPIGRLLGKISHANPFIVSRQLLRQVMGMPGMVASISESLRYLTSMTFDVLTFTIVNQLSCGKRKLKEDGVNLEEWFQWLSLFTGVVCRNQNGIEVTALVQYVVNQLKGSESLDLLVLKEIISSMTRISPSVDVSNQQLDALAGSDALIQYIVGQEEGREVSGKKDTTRATNRLLNSLKQGSENERLLLPLLILLAQQRTLIILDPPSKHLKLAAELLDKCQEVTMQYIEFLQKSLIPEEYEEILPSIEDLVMEYKIDPEIVLQLYRPILHKVKPYEIEENDEEGEISDGQLPLDDGEETQKVGDNVDAKAWSDWPIVKELMAKLAPDGGFSGISWELFVCFWAFDLSDLVVPKDRYENTLKQIDVSKRNLQDDLASRKDMMRGGQWGPNAGPQVDLGALKAELSVLENLSQILPNDMKHQVENVEHVSGIFAKASSTWIPSTDLEAQAAAAKEIVQYCILPRLFLSPKDAMYCVEFLRQIHKLGPPNLRLLSVVDRLFKELGFMVRCCTPRESTNLGIFFADLMTLVSMWREKATFEQQCLNAEAFKSYKSGELQPVSHDEFIRLSANWHKRLTLDVFKSCIVSEDYMQMKNVLLVLNRMVRMYPATKEDAEELRVTLKPISENDPREDLKTLARMYCTGLEMSVRDRQMVDTRQEYAGLPAPVRKKQPKESKPDEPVSTKKKESSVSERETKKETKREEKKEPRKTEEGREDRRQDRGSRHRSSENDSKRHRNPLKHEDRDLQDPNKDSARSKNSTKKRKASDREISRSERSGRGTHEGKREKDSRNGKQNNKDSESKRESQRSFGKHSDRKEGHSREEARRQTRDKPKSDEKRTSRNAHPSRQEPRGESRGQQGSSRDKKRLRPDDSQPSRDQSKRSRSDRRQAKPSGESKKRHQDSREFKKESAEPRRERSDRRERTRR